jgi:sugar phosphate isomerase/epimerase
MDNYKQQTEVIEEAIDLLGDDVAVVHMKDFILQGDTMVSVAAGMGELNYKPLIEFIKARKPMIHCTLEDKKPENAVAAREYIQSLWQAEGALNGF